MPSSIPSLDDMFPTLRGDESPREMFTAIVNFLYVMKESLDYTLANLSVENWNATALDELAAETRSPMEEQLEKLQRQLQTVAASVAEQKNSVNDLTRELGGTKDRVTELEDREKDLDYLLEEIVKLEDVVQIDEETAAVTIGKENVPLHLVGEVSINGVPIEEETV